jgi:hypothetical protein
MQRGCRQVASVPGSAVSAPQGQRRAPYGGSAAAPRVGDTTRSRDPKTVHCGPPPVQRDSHCSPPMQQRPLQAPARPLWPYYGGLVPGWCSHPNGRRAWVAITWWGWQGGSPAGAGVGWSVWLGAVEGDWLLRKLSSPPLSLRARLSVCFGSPVRDQIARQVCSGAEGCGGGKFH